jgi:hypothetical protein
LLNIIEREPAEPEDVMGIVFAHGYVNVIFVDVSIPVIVTNIVEKAFVVLEKSLLVKAILDTL